MKKMFYCTVQYVYVLIGLVCAKTCSKELILTIECNYLFDGQNALFSCQQSNLIWRKNVASIDQSFSSANMKQFWEKKAY